MEKGKAWKARGPTVDIMNPDLGFGPTQFRKYLRSDSGKEFLEYTLGKHLHRENTLGDDEASVLNRFIFTFLRDVRDYNTALKQVSALVTNAYQEERAKDHDGLSEDDRAHYKKLASGSTARQSVYLSRGVLKTIFNGKPARFYLLKHGVRVLYVSLDMKSDMQDDVAHKKEKKLSDNLNGLCFEMEHNTPEEMKSRSFKTFKFEPALGAWTSGDAPDVYCSYQPDVVDQDEDTIELKTSVLLSYPPPYMRNWGNEAIIEHVKQSHRGDMLFCDTTKKATLRIGFIMPSRMQNPPESPIRRPIGVSNILIRDFPASDFSFTEEDEGKLRRLRATLTALHEGAMEKDDGVYLATLTEGSGFELEPAGGDIDETVKAKAAGLNEAFDRV
eukprot:TRINITY_DN2982_c0_g1_i1.p1 TRINITY_DN2982_c0_g1~~TRINITY_DN2982_c0_g1_i1.p1  ORF type:complete len:387 (+),score=74.05 TRINITY_DN2982_c0_g1_i1:54-1214(+)